MNAIKVDSFKWAPSHARKRARTNPNGWVSMPATTPRPWDIEILCESGHVFGVIQICTNPAVFAQEVIDDLSTGAFSICETAEEEEIVARRTPEEQKEAERRWNRAKEMGTIHELDMPEARTATLRDRPVAWRARMMTAEEAKRKFRDEWPRALTYLIKWKARDA